MDATFDNQEKNLTDCTEAGNSMEELASLSEEALQKRATELLMGRSMQENPLLGQLNDMFSQWEAMMESYRQEELTEQP